MASNMMGKQRTNKTFTFIVHQQLCIDRGQVEKDLKAEKE